MSGVPPKAARSASERRRRPAAAQGECAAKKTQAKPSGKVRGWASFAPPLNLRSRIGHGGPEGLGSRDAPLERPRPDQPRDLVFVQDFLLQQGIGQRVELGPVRGQDVFCRLIALAQDPGDFLIDDARSPLTDVRTPGERADQAYNLR